MRDHLKMNVVRGTEGTDRYYRGRRTSNYWARGGVPGETDFCVRICQRAKFFTKRRSDGSPPSV